MVVTSLDAKVRPLSNPSLEKASLLGAGRVYISRDSYIALTGGLEHARHCVVERIDDKPVRRHATLWTLPGGANLSPNVVMMTRAFQEASGFKIGDQVRVSLSPDSVPDADVVVVQDVGEPDAEMKASAKHPLSWESSICLSLDRAELVFPGMVLEGVTINKLRRSFKVVSVNSKVSNIAAFKLASTAVQILPKDGEKPPTQEDVVTGGDLVLTGVPGFAKQVKQINQFLDAFTRPFYFKGERQSCALLIHGGQGAGKTFIVQRLAATGWGRPFWIRPTDKLSAICETFKQAREQQPSMVLMDGLGDLLSSDRSIDRFRLIDTLKSELDALSAMSVDKDALPRVVVVATCKDYMAEVPADLMTGSRFFNVVALPIPRAPERLEILESLNPPLPAADRKAWLEELALKTHAYTAGDLAILVLNAKKIAGYRLSEANVPPVAEGQQQSLIWDDLKAALIETRPTAMHDINLNPPMVRWHDIGGQEHVKKVLSRMIKYTQNITVGPTYSSVLRSPPKGLLLYGPPGCSKTLSAQAVATEASFNFFSVKGAELLNMYVGESERAVRNLFDRARAAAPSIIFFDEIDSMAGQRSGPGASSAAVRSTGAINMVTTLLTEMDGFETLNGVLILAATNRPEAMDPALLRPGRFDRVLYVGPPDDAARQAILTVHLRDLSVAPDVDVPRLAELTAGHSGAELKAICNEAGMLALERHDEAESDDVPLEIRMEDLLEGMARTRKNITPAMIKGYEDWSKQFKGAA